MSAATYERADDDWYVEPEGAVHALVNRETLWGSIWDPCAGGGTIPRVLRGRGYDAIGSDLVDRGAGFPTVDFLTWEPRSAADRPEHIVMNPPYRDAQEFIEKARAAARHKVCALCRLAFLESTGRKDWLEQTLSRVWVFSDRISMPPGDKLARGEVQQKGGKGAFAWFVWDPAHRGPWQGGFVVARGAA